MPSSAPQAPSWCVGSGPAAAWTPPCTCTWSLTHYHAGWPEGSQSPPSPPGPVSPCRKTSPQAPAPTLASIRAQPGWVFLKFLKLYNFVIVFISFFFSFSFKFFFYSKSCVYQPQESTDQFLFNFRRYFCEHLTYLFNKIQRKRDNMTAVRRGKLHFNWWLVRLLYPSSGLDYQIKVCWGDT